MSGSEGSQNALDPGGLAVWFLDGHIALETWTVYLTIGQIDIVCYLPLRPAQLTDIFVKGGFYEFKSSSGPLKVT